METFSVTTNASSGLYSFLVPTTNISEYYPIAILELNINNTWLYLSCFSLYKGDIAVYFRDVRNPSGATGSATLSCRVLMKHKV